MMRVPSILSAALALLLLAPQQGLAQEARYELGRRVRVFEKAWDPTVVAVRKPVSNALNRAVGSFFRLQFSEAGKALSDAQFALRPESLPSEAERWAAAVELRPKSRLIDVDAGALPVAMRAFYESGIATPRGARVALQLERAGSSAVVREAKVESLPSTLPLEWAGGLVREGDYRLIARFSDGTKPLDASPAVGVSCVAKLKPRLEALRQTISAWKEGPEAETTTKATARALLGLLENLRDGRVLETDYPAARLLGELEQLTQAIAKNQPFYHGGNPGEFWLTLALGKGRTGTTRVLVPEAATAGKPLPLVVALHGAGGSENMFFDSYGAGAIVQECQKRGWLLATPRAGAAADEVVNALAALYPVDRTRVLLVGHSMGAAMAVQAATARPEIYAAIVPLGGGGRVKRSEGLAKLPVFVGVGSDDFARPGAEGLAKAFRDAGAPTTYREYSEIEHLGIVQAALPEVFGFLEEIVKKPAK